MTLLKFPCHREPDVWPKGLKIMRKNAVAINFMKEEVKIVEKVL